MSAEIRVRRLRADDLDALADMLTLFGRAFEDAETYDGARPDAGYQARLLGNEGFVALVAEAGGTVIGALAAYVLPKFEQPRAEMYIYDLAVDADHRRRGVATALIEALKPVARAAGAWEMFVQADHPDPPAAALYAKFGVRQEVLHFSMPVG